MSFSPSPYQQNVFNFIKNGRGNAIVEAVAGSGKTTTIIQSLSFIPRGKSVLFLAFNKSVVNELKDTIEIFFLLSFRSLNKALLTISILSSELNR